MNMKISNRITWLGVFFLISLEQLIKVVINNYYLDKNIPLLPPLLYFKPMFNRDYSWFNSMLQLGIGKWLHILLVAVMSILIYKFYEYINSQIASNNAVNVMFAFAFSGAMCSLIDKIFWNGSLDYIMVNGFFTFDLKDLFVNIFIVLVILLIILKRKNLREIEDKGLLKNFIKYILKKS